MRRYFDDGGEVDETGYEQPQEEALPFAASELGKVQSAPTQQEEPLPFHPSELNKVQAAPMQQSEEPLPFDASHLEAMPQAQPAPMGAMPGAIEAGWQGVKHGITDVGQTLTPGSTAQQQEQSPAAAPFEWSDLTNSPLATGLPKLTYRLGQGSPTIAGGVLGGIAGEGLAGPVGGAIGGAAGAGVGAALQTVGPVFAEELKKTPADPDGAWSRALTNGAVSGVFSAGAWALFPAKFFEGPLKQAAFQAFGVQPGVNVAEQATKNVIAGDPVTKDLGNAYVEGAVGTAVPAAGHFILSRGETSAAPSDVVPDRSALPKTMIENMMPEMTSEKALQADPVFAEYKAGRAQERDAVSAATEHDLRAWDRVPQEDQLAFNSDLENGRPVDPALQARHPDLDMTAQADLIRTRLENAYKEEQQFGSPAGYIQDYLPHMWKDPDKAKSYFDNQAASGGPDWFQKQRTFDTLQDGIAAGLEPKFTNPVELANFRLFSGIDMRKRVELLQNLEGRDMAMKAENAPPDLAKTWTPVKAPNQEPWLVSPSAKPLWDRAIEDRSLWSQPGIVGDLFKGYMAVKNAYIVAKLGLSGFHFLHVMHIQANDALTRGELTAFGRGKQSMGERAAAIPRALKEATYNQFAMSKGRAAREAWNTMPKDQTPEQRDMVKTMTEGGFRPQMPEQFKIAGRRNFSDAIHNGQYLKALPYAARQALQGIQSLMFEKWIPNLKAASYLREAEAFAKRDPANYNDPVQRSVALRALAKQVDNRFGEMSYDGLFWRRMVRDLGVANATSMGWNLGFLREHGGAMLDPITKRTMTQTPERQTMRSARSRGLYTANYLMTAMAINGAMSYFMGGQYPEGWDYFLPRIGGNNPDGSPRRVTNMFYTREIPMLMAHVQQSGLIGGLMEMAANKGALLGPAYHLGRNADYFGRPYRDEDAPAWQQAGQLLKGMGAEGLPISITSAQRSLELSGKPHGVLDVGGALIHGDRDVIMPAVGFSAAPVYANRSDIQNKITRLYGETVAPKGHAYDYGTAEAQHDARDKYLLAMQSGDKDKIKSAYQELAATGMKPATINKLRPGDQDIGMFGRLKPEGQISILKDATAEEFKRYYPKASTQVKLNPAVKQLWKQAYRS